MNKFEHYIVDLLQHHITSDDNEVQVRRQFNDIAQLPCITLSIADVSTEKVYTELGTTEDALYERHATIDINVWCNTEDERESISEQIMQCFYREQAGHYLYCSQYLNGRCLSRNKPCDVSTVSTGRTEKNQCDNPIEYEYEPLWSKHNLIDGSVNIDIPRMLDELSEHPPLLRNLFRAEASYYDSYEVGGSVATSTLFDEVEIE